MSYNVLYYYISKYHTLVVLSMADAGQLSRTGSDRVVSNLAKSAASRLNKAMIGTAKVAKTAVKTSFSAANVVKDRASSVALGVRPASPLPPSPALDSVFVRV